MSGCSPLQLSASFKNYYSHLRDPNFPPATTPLHVAVLNSDLNRVHRLLSKGGANIWATDQVSLTITGHIKKLMLELLRRQDAAR